MIEKVILNKINCFKEPTILETDKKVNLIYGLNGSGKSTISNYFINLKNDSYSHCAVSPKMEDHEIFVYNQEFIKTNFFESENLDGIFTLSKENKTAEQNIKSHQKKIEALEKNIIDKTDTFKSIIDHKNSVEKKSIEKTWEIKKSNTGGDRVLEFCFDGLKNDKTKLINHLIGIVKPESKPNKSVEQIKKDCSNILGDNSSEIEEIAKLEINLDIETNIIWSKQIVGNSHSTIATFINDLKNTDWVKNGMSFIELEESEEQQCPFCQEKTINTEFIENLQDYFDKSYSDDLTKLKKFKDNYTEIIANFPKLEIFNENLISNQRSVEIENKYLILKDSLDDNLITIESKIKSPSKIATLKKSFAALTNMNSLIDELNNEIKIHNKKIAEKELTTKNLKNDFWNIMRWEYDQTLSNLNTEKADYKLLEQANNLDIESLKNEIKDLQNSISKEQSKTVNIQDAIDNINETLIEIGIDEFQIQKHEGNYYRIFRGIEKDSVFKSLSEGEKMIISFLYFIELTKGKKTKESVNKKRIVVIDDPISSLSHIHIFNVGRLIHKEFLRSDFYDQIFVLTHSLYFFYELTDTNKERRKESQQLFRIHKTTKGSEIKSMKYEEVQNDYQTYWTIIKDGSQTPALIANCMRNIIEYFFAFVEKRDLNNVFQKKEMQELKFQAFNRYINRESHSLGQNIFDIKEFNYQDFLDGFKLVFKETGYEAHYNKMIK